MIAVGLQGKQLSREEQGLFRDYPFGGFILFSHNLEAPEQILALCRSLWKSNKDIPPLIAIDQEGGRVHRLPAPFTHFPPAARLGATGNPELAHRLGQAAARELSAVGINLNFAPVLDVHSNPANPVIGDRSLGSDPAQAAALGWAVIRGLRAGGVIPCAKHFPGHGDTSEDSHLVLPVVKKDLAALRDVELPPFIYACQNQVESLMTSHVLYPCLDPTQPATLSYPIITKLLRREIDYEGVVFGDDMEMKAISENYALEDAVGLAVRAGVDGLMFCHRTDLAVRALESLHRDAEKSEALRARIEESYRRIQKLKRSHLKRFTGAHEAKLKNFVGLSEHRKIVEEIQGSL